MKIIAPSIAINASELSRPIQKNIEYAARLCYKTEDKVESTENFIKRIIERGHESVIEHEKITVYLTIDRGITHEIVRHRIASYSQESTRYCNYSEDKFNNEISVIEPFFYKNSEKFDIWKDACEHAEKSYMELISDGKPQEARSVLPNSLKTEIAVTYNMREWRHFFKLRCAKEAHPQMRQIAIPILLLFKKNFSQLFGDIKYDEEFLTDDYAEITIIE